MCLHVPAIGRRRALLADAGNRPFQTTPPSPFDGTGNIIRDKLIAAQWKLGGFVALSTEWIFEVK